MKRVIKFRGKRTDIGEWAYGSLLKFDIGYVITISETTESDDSLDENNSIVFSADEIAGVNPDTIGQFTGLLDKNGKEIYEGDIVQCNKDICKVVYSYHYAGFALYKQGWAYLHFFGEAFSTEDCMVIGTIHDNPELLEGGKE